MKEKGVDSRYLILPFAVSLPSNQSSTHPWSSLSRTPCTVSVMLEKSAKEPDSFLGALFFQNTGATVQRSFW
jgi:hypothetical protein